MKILLILLVPILFSCGAAVVVDYDSKTDFSQYTTYDFYPSIDSGLDDLENQRIMAALDSLMPLKGIRKEVSPQFYVNFYAREIVTASHNTLGIAIGGGGGNVGVGVSGGIPIGGNEIQQQLTLDFIDVQNDQLIWQGILEGRFKENSAPTQKEVYYQNAIQKILRQFPPSSK
jgi:Domain of unknown function (DUF4136)